MKTKLLFFALFAVLSLSISVSAHQEMTMKKQDPAMKSASMMKNDVTMSKTMTAKKKRSSSRLTVKRKIHRKYASKK